MKPRIKKTRFGSITVGNEKYDHDIYISSNGKISKRKKKLSKAIYGTSHTISEEEISHIYEDDAEGIIMGTGQYGIAKLSDQAEKFLKNQNCKAMLYPTPAAIEKWNRVDGKYFGLFHITC